MIIVEITMQSPWNHHGNSKRIAAASASRMMRAISVRPSLSPPEQCDHCATQVANLWEYEWKAIWKWAMASNWAQLHHKMVLQNLKKRSKIKLHSLVDLDSDKRRFLLDLLGQFWGHANWWCLSFAGGSLETRHSTLGLWGLEISTLFSRRD